MNLKTLCRTCLRIPINPINLFESSQVLIQKIEDVFSLKIENVSELPAQICENCFKLINITYNFKKVVLNADNDLNTRLKTLEKTNYSSKQKTNTPKIIPAVTVVIKTEIEPNDFNHINRYKKMSKCKSCNQEFTTSYRLMLHKRTHHDPRGVCNICGIETRLDNMARHMLKHNGKPVRCVECGKLCKHSDALRAHRNYQHKEKTCACEVCGLTFSMLSMLNSHMIRHKEPQRLRKSCSICGIRVLSMKRHMLSHTGERPHICTYCKKGFTSGHALKVHTRLHTNERPYACQFCDASYPQTVSLRTHLKSKHGIVDK